MNERQIRGESTSTPIDRAFFLFLDCRCEEFYLELATSLRRSDVGSGLRPRFHRAALNRRGLFLEKSSFRFLTRFYLLRRTVARPFFKNLTLLVCENKDEVSSLGAKSKGEESFFPKNRRFYNFFAQFFRTERSI